MISQSPKVTSFGKLHFEFIYNNGFRTYINLSKLPTNIMFSKCQEIEYKHISVTFPPPSGDMFHSPPTTVCLPCRQQSLLTVTKSRVCAGKHHHKVDKAMYTCYTIISSHPEAILVLVKSSRWLKPTLNQTILLLLRRDIPRTAERPRDGADGDPEGGHGAPVLQLRDGGQGEPVLDQVVQGPAGVLPVRAPRDALDEGVQRRQWHRGGGEFTFSNWMIQCFLMNAFSL